MQEAAIRNIVIIGAGPAGLTAAAELSVCKHLNITVVEAGAHAGGISRTEHHHGNHIDIGGHRFFSKSDRVNRFWDTYHPMERRPRLSRIYYKGRFFDYPVSLRWATIANLGIFDTLRAGLGYMGACLKKRPENNLEDFYINRFGRPLYSMFFESYTEKVWGKHPSQLGADWGNQRVKGLSIKAVLADMLHKVFGKKNSGNTETSLIDEFLYPAHGPGELWESVAKAVEERGVTIKRNTRVEKINVRGDSINSVTLVNADGKREEIVCDTVISSMPLPALVEALGGIDVPEDVNRVAAGLPFRDFITVGLLINKPCNLPDNWIYIQDAGVRLGRVQVFNNWSQQMVSDPARTTWLGLEYFCNEGDKMWNMSDAEFIDMAKKELAKIGLVDGDIIDAVRIRAPKAYPAYYGTYGEIDILRKWLDSINGLYCVGRNGQHRYNNMDHSMLTAMYAADRIRGAAISKSEIWQVNADDTYHESR